MTSNDSKTSEPRTQWEHLLDPGTEAIRELAGKSDAYDQMPQEERERLRAYAKVLSFLHWAMNQPEGKTKPLGELLRLGCKVCELPIPDETLQGALLANALKLVSVPLPKSSEVG